MSAPCPCAHLERRLDDYEATAAELIDAVNQVRQLAKQLAEHVAHIETMYPVRRRRPA